MVGWAGRRHRTDNWDRAVPAHVPGVQPRHDLHPRAVPARARRSPGWAVLGPGQNNGPWTGLTGSGCMAIYTHNSCSLCCGWWVVLICCERKILLAGWWLLACVDLV